MDDHSNPKHDSGGARRAKFDIQGDKTAQAAAAASLKVKVRCPKVIWSFFWLPILMSQVSHQPALTAVDRWRQHTRPEGIHAKILR